MPSAQVGGVWAKSQWGKLTAKGWKRRGSFEGVDFFLKLVKVMPLSMRY